MRNQKLRWQVESASRLSSIKKWICRGGLGEWACGSAWLSEDDLGKLVVNRGQERELGRRIVRLNIKHRKVAGKVVIKRHDVVELKHGEKSVFAILMGHKEENKISIDYDLREALGVKLDTKQSFKIRNVSAVEKLCWYLNVPDPYIHVPARIAVLALVLAVLSLLL